MAEGDVPIIPAPDGPFPPSGTAMGRAGLAADQRCIGDPYPPARAAVPRRVQLPAGRRHVRTRAADEWAAPDVGVLRDVSGDPAADVHEQVSAGAGNGAGAGTGADWGTHCGSVGLDRAGVRGAVVGAGGIRTAPLGDPRQSSARLCGLCGSAFDPLRPPQPSREKGEGGRWRSEVGSWALAVGSWELGVRSQELS